MDILEKIAAVFLLLIAIIIGFGFWYLIFWFVSGEANLFIWGPWTKAFYLILSFTATSGTVKAITE